MPKLKVSETEMANRAFIGFIKDGMHRKGKEEKDVHVLLGIALSTWYKRRGHPEDITLGQLRKVFKALDASDKLILEVFGRKGE